MSLSHNIRYLRKQQGWSQDILAEKLGYKSYTTIQKWESGVSEPPLKVLHVLSGIFHVDINDLANADLESAALYLSGQVPSYRIPVISSCTQLGSSAEYFALKVNDDSMNAARICQGDTLIVHRQDTVESGQIAVILVNGEDAIVRRFYHSGSQVTLVPQSSNPVHQPQIYDTAEAELHIVGLVVKNEITFQY